MKTLRVLIVEDYLNTAELLALWVKTAGHEVKVCHTGFTAEQAMPAFQPDIVLLDIGLPDMYGWELAPLLRQAKPSVMIAAVSASQSDCDHQRSKAAGIDLHLDKPVLRETIQRLLESAGS